MTQLSVRRLVVSYGPVVAVDGITFEAETGEFVSLLGPSGCGKTTTLRCIAGLETASGGEIRIGEQVVAMDGREVPPEKRDVNMVFQSYAVWPHMSVFDNVAYGLRTQRRPAREIGERVTEALRLVGLSGYESRFGTELSGGQQQRVAVARAIVTAPQLLLFDEPLSNLDAGLRERMRFELVALQRKLGRTSIYVTHDQAEAMVMSDRIILMNRGRIVQQGSPRELYEKPANRFAAEFIGNANLLEGTVVAEHPSAYRTIRLADGTELRGRPAWADRAPTPDGDVLVCVRPEVVQIVPPGTTGENSFAARVTRVSYLGASLSCELRVGATPLRVDLPTRSGLSEGADTWIRIDPDSVVIVPDSE
jgi:ABC-type Fe3+/spermidine/putrescine transport system ATPase subunit